jgi:hypothetical protein
MIHFVPQDGVYVYFRINGGDKVMVVINNSDQNKTIDLKRFEECLQGVKSMENIMTDEITLKMPASITIPKHTPQVWKLNGYEVQMEMSE